MGSSDEIIALARQSGLPYQVGSTYRGGATTLSGRTSYHATDNAVDFTGYNQDALARYFLELPTLEVIHHSNLTGVNYATSNGKPFPLRGALLEQHRGHLHVAANEAKAQAALAGGSGRGPIGGGGLDVARGIADPVTDWIGSKLAPVRDAVLQGVFVVLGLALLGVGVYRAVVGPKVNQVKERLL